MNIFKKKQEVATIHDEILKKASDYEKRMGIDSSKTKKPPSNAKFLGEVENRLILQNGNQN